LAKALVTTLMQMVIDGMSTRRSEEIKTELCGRGFGRRASGNLTEKLCNQVKAGHPDGLGRASD